MNDVGSRKSVQSNCSVGQVGVNWELLMSHAGREANAVMQPVTGVVDVDT